MKKNNKNIFDHISLRYYKTHETYIADCYLDNRVTDLHIYLIIADIALHIIFAFSAIIIFCLEY